MTSVARSAPDGIWVPGGGIEIPCEYVLYGMKKDHEKVRQMLQNTEVEEAKARRLKLPCVTVYFLVIVIMYMYAMLNDTRVILPHE